MLFHQFKLHFAVAGFEKNIVRQKASALKTMLHIIYGKITQLF